MSLEKIFKYEFFLKGIETFLILSYNLRINVNTQINLKWG